MLHSGDSLPANGYRDVSNDVFAAEADGHDWRDYQIYKDGTADRMSVNPF